MRTGCIPIFTLLQEPERTRPPLPGHHHPLLHIIPPESSLQLRFKAHVMTSTSDQGCQTHVSSGSGSEPEK